jgi:mRNA-degrading endonuclease RelE of RelBE toxin-antitoxin system
LVGVEIFLENYTAMPYIYGMIFIEASVFTRLLPNYLSDDEYRALQWYLLERPDAGDIVPGSRGARKIRWSQAGRGKRGGIRVIYFWKESDNEIWMITIYAKSEKTSIPAHLLKKIAEEIQNE